MDPVTLSQLCAGIQIGLEDALPDMYWVVAEIAELTSHRNGHCYLTLIEKGPKGEPIAQLRGTIWAARWEAVRYAFLEATGQALTAGMRVLLAATVEFHPRYGLSLDVRAVDASFTLGELAKARQAALEKLDRLGLLALNKRFELPPIVHRLAVISSATAAGYQDFLHQLGESSYAFQVTLFPATMQGAEAPASVRRALRAVAKRAADFDAIVVIRGGGARTDLLAFDDYALAAALARAPLPVLTGIGHERDESLCDLVAHTRLKTPTAVAAFLIERSAAAEGWLLGVAARVRATVRARLAQERRRLHEPLLRLPLLWQARLTAEHRRFSEPLQRLPLLLKGKLAAQQNRLALAEARTQAADPARLLARGFTLTTRPDGRPLRFATDVQPGDALLTHFADGTVRSVAAPDDSAPQPGSGAAKRRRGREGQAGS